MAMKKSKKMIINQDMDLSALSTLSNLRLEHIFRTCLHNIPSLQLKQAMEYSLFNAGKRLRPLLIYATGAIFDAPLENLDIAACSVELIHTYSLIHDDLPCMDNSDLRRGKPTSHKVYGEGMAVLTGDALHTLAMQIIASHKAPLSAQKRVEMMRTLSQACGPFGMAAGQAMDITLMQDADISSDLLLNIYHLKTGALINACLELGRLASDNDDEIHQHSLQNFGRMIGLAFQIQDDILDLESSTMGKPQGLDELNNKNTYVKIHGLNTAKEKVANLYEQALDSINYLGNKAHLLRELANQMLKRRN